MSFNDAVSALDGAIAQDYGSEPAVPAAPVEQAAPAPTTPEGQIAPVQPGQLRDEQGRFAPPPPPVQDTAPDLFEGSGINPDTLPPELQPLAKQLQGAFTQKTQALAEQRRQYESLGDLNQVRQATELYRSLQDPGFLQEFHGALTGALEAQGLSPAHARMEAARQIEEQTAPTHNVNDALARLKDDPELAPVAELLNSLQQRQDAFERQQQERTQQETLVAQQMAMAGELQRAEMAILQQHPTYTQHDIDAVYELSAFFDGNLFEANSRYQAITNAAVERYLNSKSAPVAASAPVQGTGISTVPAPGFTSLQDAYKAALGALHEQGIDTLA